MLPPELRKPLIAALEEAHRTHPCKVTGSTYWTGCHHPDDTSATCHFERRADAVLEVLERSFPAIPALRSATLREASELIDEDSWSRRDKWGQYEREEFEAGMRAAAGLLLKEAGE